MVMVTMRNKAMYEVHYSDGADHAGVGRFDCWHDAKRFVDAVRATGYEAYITDLAGTSKYMAALESGNWNGYPDKGLA